MTSHHKNAGRAHFHTASKTVLKHALTGAYSVALGVISVLPAMAHSAYPERAIKIIVPWPPGGASDTVTRLLANEIEKSLHQPVVVENKPGAYTFVAAQSLMSSKPDGYIFMTASNDTLTINQYLVKAPYDIKSSFEYVGIFGEYQPAVLVARKDFPANDAKQAVDYLRKNPGKVNFASHGTGSTSHIRATLMLANLNTEQNHIPYKGGAPALQDLAGGQVDLLVDTPISSLPLIRSGRIKALATMGKERYRDLPEVMTLKEAGSGGADFVTFQGMIAPRGTPATSIKIFTEAMAKALEKPVLRKALDDRGLIPIYRGPAEFRNIVLKDSEIMEKVISENHIAPK